MPLTVPADTGVQVRAVYADAVDRIITVVRDQVAAMLDGAGPAMVRRRTREEVARLVEGLNAEGAQLLADELETAARDGHDWVLAALLVLGRRAAGGGPRQPNLAVAGRYLTNATSRIVGEADTAVRRVTAEPERAQRAMWWFAGPGVAAVTLRGTRTVELESYAEMVTVNSARDARMFAAADQWMRSGGSTLVKVSGPLGGACPLCRPWEAQVLSLGGTDTRFPSLDTAVVAGLFHPNCRHIVTPWHPDLEGVDVVAGRSMAAVREARDARVVEARRKARFWARREQAALDRESRRRAQGHRKRWQGVVDSG